jgi:hypothetical protein
MGIIEITGKRPRGSSGKSSEVLYTGRKLNLAIEVFIDFNAVADNNMGRSVRLLMHL